jgi:uncharacterized protein
MKETVLITGASSGIGMELAGVFAKHGYNLVLVARDVDRLGAVRDALAAAYGVVVTVLPLDLSVSGAPEALVDALREQGVVVDVFVNNAGVGMYGNFVDADPEKLRAMIRTNVMVPTMLARMIGAQMADRGRGKILNVASLAGFMPGPWMAAYYATKAHLLSLSEALAAELGPHGVTVTALCPGPTDTPFMKRSGMERSKLVAGRKLYSAKKVAEHGYRALMRGKRVAVPGLKAKLLAFGIRFAPRSWVARVVSRIQGPR